MSDTLKCIKYIVTNAKGQPIGGPGIKIAVLVGDINGNQPVNATTQPGSPLASIFADPQGSHSVANPATTDGLGNLCSTVDGVTNIGVWVNTSGYGSSSYFVLQVYGAGIVGQQLIPFNF